MNWPEPSGTDRGRFEDGSRKGRGRGGGGSAVRPGRRSRRWRGALLGASAGRWGRWPDPFGTPAESFGGPYPEGSVKKQGDWFGAEAKNQAQKKTSPGGRSLPVVEGSPSIAARVLCLLLHPPSPETPQPSHRPLGVLTTPRTPPGKSGLGSLPFAFPAEQMREIDSQRMR